MRKLLFTLLFTFFALQVQGQYCGSDEYMPEHNTKQERQRIRDYEKSYRGYVKNYTPNPNRATTIYQVPVVFHNIATNVSEDKLNEAIDKLNNEFDFTSNDPNPAQYKVEFCLHKINNISNSPWKNINRDTEDHISLKNSTRWNPSEFLNVWIVKTITNNNNDETLGFAAFPSDYGKWNDGIVMRKSAINGDNDYKIFVHEVGHYFGLLHIFQKGSTGCNQDAPCKNDNCLEDGDKVCDTAPVSPPIKEATYDGCNSTEDTCPDDNMGDDIDNYMSYNTNWTCLASFTLDQKIRMQKGLETRGFGSSGPCNLTPSEPLVLLSHIGTNSLCRRI